METPATSRTLAYAVIVLGAVLTFAAAVVPYYGTGYQLRFGVVLAGLTPYFVYALAVPLLRGALTATVGLALVVLHAALVIRERFLQGADYSDGLIYIGPLVLAVVLLPLLWRALREPWGGELPAERRPH